MWRSLENVALGFSQTSGVGTQVRAWFQRHHRALGEETFRIHGRTHGED